MFSVRAIKMLWWYRIYMCVCVCVCVCVSISIKLFNFSKFYQSYRLSEALIPIDRPKMIVQITYYACLFSKEALPFF